MPKPTLRIIRPSSREQHDQLASRLKELQNEGFSIIYDDLAPDSQWPYTAAHPAARAKALTQALTEQESDVVLCARGGYGASDMLPLLPWSRLGALARHKPIVGFSDVSALHCAFYALLGWPGIHGPMPATSLWGEEGTRQDIEALFTVLTDLTEGRRAQGSLSVEKVPGVSSEGPITGKLFGGCFTVLTNLIGTPYFPRSLEGHIIFIEDTDEHPARLLRAFNQWLYAGALEGASALVVGHLRRLGDNIPDNAAFVCERLAERCPIPLYHTTAFGHTCPNMPLMIGAEARIEGHRLNWQSPESAPVNDVLT